MTTTSATSSTTLLNALNTQKVDAATSLKNKLETSNVGKSGTGEKSLGQTDYLKLMTAQLQYQDPFAPMDNSQMVAQMAQFSQIAASTESNTTLKSISEALSGSRLSDAASWIGKSMLVKSSTVAPDASGSYAGQVSLTEDSSNLSVELVDSAGSVVKTINMGAQKAGDLNFYWSGEDDAGERVANGSLSIRVQGGKVSQTAAWATVAAVQSPASGSDAKLITTLGNFTAADALSLG